MGFFSRLKGSSKAQEAEQERAEASSSNGPTPPPYMPAGDDRDSEDAPDYERPLYASGGSAMAKFPPTFNIYFSWKSMSKFHIGTSREAQSFIVASHWGWYARKPPITIYNGLSTDDPILVQAGPIKAKMSQECTITVPSRPDRPAPPLELKAGYIYESWKDSRYRFNIRVPSRGNDADGKALAPQDETFEWRTSSGEEVRAPNGGSRMSSGWKLVWVTGPEAGEGGKRKERELGFTSDGREVVAVAAHNTMGKSITKPLRFAFMGTGLTGTLGEDWEAVAVATALQLWWMYQMTNAAAAASASSG